MLGFSVRNRSISSSVSQIVSSIGEAGGLLTLFAGFVFNFSNIFWDWALVALILGDWIMDQGTSADSG